MPGSSPESYVAPTYSLASKVSLDSNDRRMFPMMVVLLQTLLEMSSMKSHEELLTTGALVEFRLPHGNGYVHISPMGQH